jgi:hypothetical protein
LSAEGQESVFLEVDAFTVSISDSALIRVYSDTRPHNWKIADLQKGLIFVYKGVERVSEGSGFGLPVLVYEDETLFSGSSKVFVSRRRGRVVLRKEYLMDTIVRDKLRNVKLENKKARALSRYLAEVYQKHRRLRFLSLKRLLTDLGVQSSFVRATPAGRLIVTYDVHGDVIEIKAEPDILERRKPCRLFMLNEQGSRFFRRYRDSSGAEFLDKQIGAWDIVRPEWACLANLEDEVGFRLWKVKNGVLRVGREFMEGSLDWVGLDYEVNPKNSPFRYKVEIVEGTM